MSQSKVEFIKKAKYQVNKTADVLSEIEKVTSPQKILNAQINQGDSIIDGEMPIDMLSTVLNWDEIVPNDMYVGIGNENRAYVLQNLEDKNIEISFPDDFSFKIHLDSGVNTITIPSNSAYIADFLIYWGDGTASDITSYDSPNLTHTYATSDADYIITIRGTCEYLRFSSDIGITELLKMKSAKKLQTLSFKNQTNLTVIDSSWNNFPEVEDFDELFYGCSSLTSIPNDMFHNSPNVTSFYRTFFSSGLEEISADAFRYCPLVTNFRATFNYSEITEIPELLFRYNEEVTDFSDAFSGTNITYIPLNLFRNNLKVTTFYRTFSYCSLLETIESEVVSYSNFDGTEFLRDKLYNTGAENESESINLSIFSYNEKVEDYSFVFSYCSLNSIPIGLFDASTLVDSFEYSFHNCSSITEIPESLFYNNINATTFNNLFDDCINITSIPSGLFDNNVEMLYFNNVFYNCSSITEIPEHLFDNNIKITQIAQAFKKTNIAEIPTDLFKYNTEIVSFYETFSNCSQLTLIPNNLFDNNIKATNFFGAFRYSGVAEIPTDLFKYNTEADSFRETFRDSNITSIPTDLFRYNTKVVSFESVFYGTNITEIPDNLFDYNTEVLYFSGAFMLCENLYKVQDELFRYNTKAVSFNSVFDGCTRIAQEVIGTGKLYDWMQSHNPSSAINCFANCDNIIDWDLIPTTWGGGGLSALTNTLNLGISIQYEGANDFTLPINNALNTGIDITVDWGDGSATTHITDYTSSTANHTYVGVQDISISITGKLKYLYFDGEEFLKEIGVVTRNLGIEKIAFKDCLNLDTINDNSISKLGNLIYVDNLFYGCNSLTSIPNYLLGHNIESMDSAFEGCANLAAVPLNLFYYVSKVTNINNLFKNCSSITSIPSGYFDSLSIEYFLEAFRNSGLTSIASNLFDKSINMASVAEAFRETPLTAIPDSLFLYNTKIDDYSNCFNGCANLTTAVTGTNDFIGIAETNASNEGITIDKTGCFDGCSNITDYTSIPVGTNDWRTT